jgi:hypothetical protein
MATAAGPGRTIAVAHAADQETICPGNVDGFTVQCYADRLEVTRAGTLVLSFGAVAAREWEEIRKHANGRALTLQMTYTVLSAVGPWLSVEEGVFCDCGGAHPTAILRFHAYDLRESRPERGAPADLSIIFPEDTILSALLRNRSVAATLREAGRPAPSRLADLLSALAFKTFRVGDCSYFFDKDLLSSFAFDHVAGNDAAIYLSLPPAGEICRGELTQLQILLPVPAGLSDQLRAATGGRGLLMEHADLGRKTTFDFSYKP